MSRCRHYTLHVLIPALVVLQAGAIKHAFAQPFNKLPIVGVREFQDCSMSWGDYDNDGDPDLAIAGTTTGSIVVTKIYRNDGQDGLGAWILTDVGAPLTGVTNCSLAWGDYDGDLDLDLVVAGRDASGTPITKVYNNDLVFTEDTTTATGIVGVENCSVAWGDYDGDLDLDLVIAGKDGTGTPITKVYNNDLVFTEDTVTATGIVGVENCSVAWGDYDGDLDLDLIIAGSDITGTPIIKVYNNDSVFTEDTTNFAVLAGVKNCSVAWGDYDNDLDLDLALAGTSSTGIPITIVYNNDLVFTEDCTTMAGVENCSLSWGNYNNDSYLDLVVIGKNASAIPIIQVYRNDGFDGMGGQIFTDLSAGLTGVYNGSVAWTDLDDNGQDDLAIAGFDGSSAIIKIYYYEGSDTFADVTPIGLAGVQQCSVAWGDYDDDGDPDLAISGAADFTPVSKIYRNDGEDGVGGWLFTDISAPLVGVMASSLDWGDYDGDDDLDLVICGDANPADPGGLPTTKLYRNEGNDVFVDANAGLLGMKNCALEWGDYDGDNDPDLVVAGIYNEYEPPITRLYNNDLVFTNVCTTIIGLEYGSVSWGDFDGDHDLDLAICGTPSDSTGQTRIYRNEGGNVFADSGIVLTGVLYSALAWGDYDNDGDPDLVVTGRDPSFNAISKIYRNDPGGVLNDIGASILGAYDSSVAWVDLDNDGERDLAIAGIMGSTHYSRIYHYEGSDIFTDIGAGLTGLSASSLSFGDIDQDGDADLALAGWTTGGLNVSEIYRNDGRCGDPLLDTDLDGVPDCVDNCPADPNKSEPGTCGCGTPDSDTDNDGTPNCIDDCPNDPNKIEPGICGCGVSDVDSDNDGTADCNDNCPNDPNKIDPGICGCGTPDEIDSDNDGTPDCVDNCPTDPNKIDPGICGCGTPETDSDNDGTPDCVDNCPTDPNKTDPGLCGCGTPETDSDNDGTPDCVDGCPNDPNKIDPGLCDCGTPETDSDNDGTPDCVDSCPNDPNKTDPGLCGCGTPETDSDNDGTQDCVDGCPTDPNKIDPGICDCGTPETDSDNDGTPDCVDNCPTDPNKIDPGICGCGTPDETDSDNDGTPDCVDGCPNDPNKIESGQCGCSTPDTDTDTDTVADCIDNCLNAPNPGQEDGDDDGVGDVCDNCPNTPNTNQADADNDDVGDACDSCPNDPNKIESGQCGCGTPDTDTDTDTVADCIDNCLNDPNPTQVDTDTDGVGDACDNCPNTPNTNQADEDIDGFGDACDMCPYDPNKIDMGICGCGTPDTDTDNDGVADCIDKCQDTPPGGIIDPLTGCPPQPGDFDHDTDVDANDFFTFETCATGPAIPYDPQNLPPACMLTLELNIISADFDSDGDVDQNDFAKFQRCFTGMDEIGDPTCAD
ncbi:MAG: FG-GAP repeat domain-containing protein [Planctomycetota bacterium]|jgi:hypothetical protein